jgi:threonine/homoserine/homoserine lactone efflux protein
MVGFLLTAVGVSLSGVMAPGPLTAATLAAGTRGRHAGAVMALGHAVIEFPIILLVVTGVGKLLQWEGVKAAIGLAGGIVLLLMGLQLLIATTKVQNSADASTRKHPFVLGIALTAGNPYFLLWWATVGLALATQAIQWGAFAFVLFAIVHWLCDLVWLEALSLATFKGSELLGRRTEQVVLLLCGVMLVAFAFKFFYDAGAVLLARL